MTTRYFDLSAAEKLALTGEQFQDAVRIEAIHRGVKPPTTLSDALRQACFTGFVMPREAVTVFEVIVSGKYSGISETGLAYLSKERALAALEGAVGIDVDGYGAASKRSIREAELSIREAALTLVEPRQFNSTIKEFTEDNKPFEKLAEECRDDLSSIRQADYDHKVNLTKRAEYMRLAGNDETIARAFWAKTEGTEFPIAE